MLRYLSFSPDDPSVELLAVSSIDESRSTTTLHCSGTGLNPKIVWLYKSEEHTGSSKQTMQEDGRVKVSSELLVSLKDWNDGVEFTCKVNDQNQSKPAQNTTSVCAGILHVRKVHDLYRNPHRLTRASVRLYTNVISSSPVTPDSAQMAQVYLLGPSIHDVKSKGPVPVTCLLLAQSSKLFSITWKIKNVIYSGNVTRQDPKVHSNGTESIQSVLKVPRADWNAHTIVSCEVKHLCSNNKMQYSISKPRGKCSHSHAYCTHP